MKKLQKSILNITCACSLPRWSRHLITQLKKEQFLFNDETEIFFEVIILHIYRQIFND